MKRCYFLALAWTGVLLSGAVWAAESEDLFQQLDKNEDKFITRDEVGEDRVRLFERLLRTSDANDDGKLDAEEFSKGLQPRPAPTETPASGPAGPNGRPLEADFLFRRLDANQDGQLTLEEVPEARRADLKRAFERLQIKDGEGITLEQFRRVAGAGGRPDGRAIEEMFRRGDANGDGKLELDEIPEERRGPFEQSLGRFDANGDKALSLDEFRSAMSELTRRQDQAATQGTPPPGLSSNRAEGARGMGGLPLLRALDRDQDGELSAEELADASKSLASLDKNGDGKLSRNEYLPQFPPAMAGLAGSPEERMRRLLRMADKDENGKLSREEAPPFLIQAFERGDANADGQLDESELQKIMERFGPAANRKPTE